MGIPPFSGFWGKFYVFKAALAGGSPALTAVAVFGLRGQRGRRLLLPAPDQDDVVRSQPWRGGPCRRWTRAAIGVAAALISPFPW